jgi:hypothetical protein
LNKSSASLLQYEIPIFLFKGLIGPQKRLTSFNDDHKYNYASHNYYWDVVHCLSILNTPFREWILPRSRVLSDREVSTPKSSIGNLKYIEEGQNPNNNYEGMRFLRSSQQGRENTIFFKFASWRGCYLSK